ncbi:unnamed protein product [Trichobilharzia regenti]|nr:unnamed protein product [Trichobilharzia regenti]
MLMPLLGITNFIVLLPEPNNVFGFFIVCGLRKVLPTWQGFTVSIIYYFMNKDVQKCLQMSIRKFKLKHQLTYPDNSRVVSHSVHLTTIPATSST